MSMDFYFKDLYPESGYIQTTEQTVPDSHDAAEVVDNVKAAGKADEAKGTKASGFKIAGVVIVILCLAALMGGKK